MANVAEYIVQQLAAWGVQRIYGVVGDTFFPLMDAIAAQGQIGFVAVRHEAAAGFMASAEAKLTGRPGVCVATSGPGIANLMNGLGDAWADRAPVVAITGQVDATRIGTESKQYVDQQSLVRPLAGYTALLAHPDAAGSLLPMALRTAVGEGRVAHLSVPKDLLAMPCQARVLSPEPYLTAPPIPAPEVIGGAADLMAGARRPLMLLGQGARPAAPAALALAENWGAGLLTSLPARGCVPWSHPLVLGGLGEGGTDAAHTALQEADLLLTLGCNWWPQGYVPQELRVIKVDRLPANIGGPMPVTYGIAGDVRTVVPALLERLGAAPGGPGGGGGAWAGGTASASGPALAGDLPTGRTEWTGRLQQLKQAWMALISQRSADKGPPLSPQKIVRALEHALPPDAIITLDTGDHTVWFGRIFGGTAQEILVSGLWRSLGYGLPAALAAKLARPDRTVAALVGDTGLMSLMGELVTAAELALPITILVVNNGRMAIEHNRCITQGHTTLGTMPRNPDFAMLARACGLAAHTAITGAELREALQSSIASSGPTLIYVHAASPVAPTALS